MISIRGVARAAVLAVLLAAGASLVNADTHAPWPTNWNDWTTPTLWVPVGNLGNAPDDTGYGAVAYTFNMGKFEVTAGQYTAFLNAAAKTDTYGLYSTSMWSDAYGCKIQRSGTSGSYSYSVASDWANRPVNYVSWGDAARFANWLTNGQLTGAQGLTTTENGSYYLNGATTNAALMAVTRKTDARYVIPTEDEWYKAAYHKNDGVTGNYFDYPTGSDTAPGQDMSEATNSGNNANFYTSPYALPIDSGTYYSTVAGEFQLSDSPYGTFDQGGNLFEWNEAIPYAGYRGHRGGAFWTGGSHSTDYLNVDDWQSAPAADGSNSWGFRVAYVPEPATLSLLALAGLGMLARRRRK